MSEAEFQACLARIYVDEPFRLLSRLDPGVTIDRYELSPDERSAILGLDNHLVDDFANSLRNKRRERFEMSFPTVFQIDRSRALRLWNRFYDLTGTIAYLSMNNSLLAFSKFLEESIERCNEWPPYTHDLVAFEAAIFGAIPTEEEDGGSKDLPENTDPAQLNYIYTLADNVQLRTFRYDVFKLRDKLTKGDVPSHIEEDNTHIAILKHSNHSLTRFFKINEPALLAVENCDGIQTAKEIATKLEAHYNSSNLEEPVLKLIFGLQSRGIIRRQNAST